MISQMYSAHDNVIISYEVYLKKRIIMLHTEERTHHKNIEIIFTDVLAHCFEDEIPGSVIFDICESDISSFISYNTKLIECKKNKNWPCAFDTVDELEQKLKNEEYKYFLITASYGFTGWVIAKHYSTT